MKELLFDTNVLIDLVYPETQPFKDRVEAVHKLYQASASKTGVRLLASFFAYAELFKVLYEAAAVLRDILASEIFDGKRPWDEVSSEERRAILDEIINNYEELADAAIQRLQINKSNIRVVFGKYYLRNSASSLVVYDLNELKVIFNRDFPQYIISRAVNKLEAKGIMANSILKNEEASDMLTAFDKYAKKAQILSNLNDYKIFKEYMVKLLYVDEAALITFDKTDFLKFMNVRNVLEKERERDEAAREFLEAVGKAKILTPQEALEVIDPRK